GCFTRPRCSGPVSPLFAACFRPVRGRLAVTRGRESDQPTTGGCQRRRDCEPHPPGAREGGQAPLSPGLTGRCRRSADCCRLTAVRGLMTGYARQRCEPSRLLGEF